MYLHGLVLRRLGEKDASHGAFMKAHFYAPLEAGAWGGFAAGLLERQEFDKAASTFRVALFLDESHADFWGDLGIVEASQEHFGPAHHAFGKAIELGQGSFANYFNRGWCSLHLGDDLAFIADWTKALDVAPDHPRAAEMADLIRARTVSSGEQRFYFGDSA